MLQILFILKFILFTNLIKVEHNRLPVIIISSLIAIFVVSLINSSKLKLKKTYGLIFYSLISVLMLINATYFSQFHTLTSVVVLSQVTQLKTVGDSIKVLLNIKILALILDIPLLIIYYIYKSRAFVSSSINDQGNSDATNEQDNLDIINSEVRSDITDKESTMDITLDEVPRDVILTEASDVILSTVEESPSNRFKNILERFRKPIIIGTVIIALLGYYSLKGQMKSIVTQELFTYHILDIRKNLIMKEDPVIASGVLTKEDLDDLKLRAKLEEGELTGIGKDKNLIVLQVEALQNFVIDLEYNGQEITPNLNKLIHDKSSVYFDNYYQLLGRGNTSDAEFVSQNSLHPSMEEASYMQYEKNTFYGLPWLLRDQGYNAWVFHGYEKTFWNREKAYVNQGFQRFLSEEDFEFTDSIGFGLKDEDFVDQSMDYLKELDKIDDNPFYAFMITLTSHTPFVMPEEYQVLNIKDEHKNTMLGSYLQAIHYTDKEIGRFIENLKKEGLYDNTVIALYGDHFAIPSVHKEDQEMMTKLLGYNYDYDTMMNIPLVIHVPGEYINETISTIGSQIDFYPTITNVMGYENNKGLVFGRDLVNYKEQNYVYPQTYMQRGSFMDGENMFVIARDGIFDHSKATSIKTREELDINDFREQYEKAVNEINKSNFILKKNLLKEYIENYGEVNLSLMQGINLSNKEYITEAHSNSLEELNKNYEDGHRLISVDLQWTRDDQIVLLKDWYWYYNNLFENPTGHLSLEEFKSAKMKNNQTQMTFEDLIEWAKDHEDAYVILRTTEERDTIFVKAKDEYPEAKDRFIVEIKHFEHYTTTTYYGFKNVLLDISKRTYSNEDIIDFTQRYSLLGVVMDRKRAITNLPKELRKIGVESYVQEENPLNRLLIKDRVTGFYK